MTEEETIQQLGPVGLTPKWLWIETRLHEINAAMLRYAEAKKIIPVEWLQEYLEHSNELIKLKKYVSERGNNPYMPGSTNWYRYEMGMEPLTNSSVE